jgi:hypothetical protein
MTAQIEPDLRISEGGQLANIKDHPANERIAANKACYGKMARAAKQSKVRE